MSHQRPDAAAASCQAVAGSDALQPPAPNFGDGVNAPTLSLACLLVDCRMTTSYSSRSLAGLAAWRDAREWI
jgi:hypothetical protein